MSVEVFYWIYWIGAAITALFYLYLLTKEKDESYDDPGLALSAGVGVVLVSVAWFIGLPFLIWSWRDERKQKV